MLLGKIKTYVSSTLNFSLVNLQEVQYTATKKLQEYNKRDAIDNISLEISIK